MSSNLANLNSLMKMRQRERLRWVYYIQANAPEMGAHVKNNISRRGLTALSIL